MYNSTNKTCNKIIIIGCGLHFKERYYTVLHEHSLTNEMSIELLVDLECQRQSILDFFSNKKLKPKNFVFLSDKYRNELSQSDCSNFLDTYVKKNNIDSVLICTEPKAHKTYALWAIRNKLNVFMDKPITAFSEFSKRSSLYSDYTEICDAINSENNSNFVISCERRMHPGYMFLLGYISEIVGLTKVPITHIDIHFGGGMWNMPDEYLYRENHPYKYGYGVLLHSGYHYIDLMSKFLNLNNIVYPVEIENIDLSAYATRPSDMMHVLNDKFYDDFFPEHSFGNLFNAESIQEISKFGELDVVMIGKLKHLSATMTTLSLRLIETTSSMRISKDLPKNTYTDNGRLRQENITIHIGTICSITVNSTSRGLCKKNDSDGIEEFNIDIINNPKITNKPSRLSFSRKDLTELYPYIKNHDKLNIYARQKQLSDFLLGNDGNSSIFDHKDSIRLLDKVFNAIE